MSHARISFIYLWAYKTLTKESVVQSDNYFNILVLRSITLVDCGPDSSVGIATDYGLDGPGSNPGGDEIFRQSRPALGPTQPPVKWVQGLSRG